MAEAKKRKSWIEQDQEDFMKNKPKRDAEALDQARKMMREGLAGEKDIVSRISPIAKKQATEHFKAGLNKYNEKELRGTREKQAYDEAGYKKGGYVKTADGCAQRGKTKGRMV